MLARAGATAQRRRGWRSSPARIAGPHSGSTGTNRRRRQARSLRSTERLQLVDALIAEAGELHALCARNEGPAERQAGRKVKRAAAARILW